MPRILVVHYEPGEALRLAERVRREGFDAEAYPHVGAKGLRTIRENPPAAILIDLARMPSYGKWMGVAIRENKGTAQIPLVFVEGEPEKTANVRQVLPDATFSRPGKLKQALERALKRASKTPLKPQLHMEPAYRKLGIQPNSVLALLRAPGEFSLGSLPETVEVRSRAEGAAVVLTFLRSTAALGRELTALQKQVQPGIRVWIVWPKKSSALAGELSIQRIVGMCRSVGLSAYKTCSVNETWSAVAVSRAGARRAVARPFSG